MLRPLVSLLVMAGALLLAGGAPARAQFVVEPGVLSVSLAQGEAAERAVTVTNTGAEAVSFCLSFDRPLQQTVSSVRLEGDVAPCGEVGEVLYRIDRTTGPSGWFPFSLTMTPDGRLFVADYTKDKTYELTPDLKLVRSFGHPVVAELEPFPVTIGVVYNPDAEALWWLNVENIGSQTLRALLLEGDLYGNATGRRIELPLIPIPAPYYATVPLCTAYDPATARYYCTETYNDVVYAVDTLGAVVEGYPVAQTAYPTGVLGNGLDAHGGVAGGAEGVRLEVPVALTHDITFFRLVVLDRHGESLGMETVVPDLSDGTKAWSVVGNPLRSRLDPNGVMYVTFSNFATNGVVGIRPHPLPPSWLAVDRWSGTLLPGESVEVALTFSAGERAVGDYTASLQVIEAASGAVVEVPLALSVTQGTAVESGPESEEVRLEVYPNPARGRAEVVLTLPEAGAIWSLSEVEVSVYDVLGRRVAVVHSGRLGAGEHTLALDLSGLPPGVYVVRAEAGGAWATRTVTMLR